MTTEATTQNTVIRSADGTQIAISMTGEGATLVLIEPAGHYRGFSAYDGLVPLLRKEFTVVTYDRRARGYSTNVEPYAVEREVEDLAAVIDHVGGPAFVHGASSGGLLAMQAVAHGLPIRRLSLVEPPLDDDTDAQAAFAAELQNELMTAGKEGALSFFLGSILPHDLLVEMRGGPEWQAMADIAHTLIHDSLLSQASGTAMLALVEVPTLVVDSAASSEELTTMAGTVAQHLPDAQRRTLAGQWHGVDDDDLVAVLRSWFAKDGEPQVS